MKNVREISFSEFKDKRGSLSAIEGGMDIPFEIKRIYYITNIPPNTDRGFHSHYELEQILLCLNGSVTIRVESDQKGSYLLDNPSQGLYIGPMVWREMTDFSKDAVLLVLASKHYSEKDYIKDYAVFQKAAAQHFNL